MRVEKFSAPFFGPFLAKCTRGDTTCGIGPIPLGGYVKITGMNPAEEIPPEHAHRAYYSQPVWKRIVVILAGPVVNIVLAFLILWVLFSTVGQQEALPRVKETSAGSPAAAVLRPGDEIVAVDGKRGKIGVLAGQISSHRCAGTPKDGCKAAEPARITVERDGREQTFPVTPVYSAAERRDPRGHLLRDPRAPGGGLPRGRGPQRGADVARDHGHRQGHLPALRGRAAQAALGRRRLLRGDAAIRRGVRDPHVLRARAHLALAGADQPAAVPAARRRAHLLAVAEKLRGRPVSFRLMERASMVGIGLVLILFIIGLNNDVNQLLNGGFKVR
jgi:regulator of sigma E protease